MPDPQAEPHPGLIRRNADDRLLAPLRQHRLLTILGLLVALVAAVTRFVAVGILPPSIAMKPFAHATASTQVVVGNAAPSRYSLLTRYDKIYPARAYALTDMVASPEIAGYVARAAGLPVSKLGILGPLWTELWQQEQWASGPKRASQIVSENDPYHITLGVEANSRPWAPVINVAAQAPTTVTAARLASAVAVGLNAYLLHSQTATGVPARYRYDVSQLGQVSVAPPRSSQMLSVGLFTFFAVFVLWVGMVVAVSSSMRDVRARLLAAKVGDGLDRSSDRGRVLSGDRLTPLPDRMREL